MGLWGGPTKGRLSKFDFPSANFWVKIFFGWVGLRAKRPPPSYKQSLICCVMTVHVGDCIYKAWK